MPYLIINGPARCALVERDQGTTSIYLVKHAEVAFESQPIATQL